jgi:hypothetical protein
VCKSLLSVSTRIRTTVLATDKAKPKTIPAAQLQPKARATTAPSTVARRLWTIAPGRATRRTARSSLRWNCSPTPNISRITPTSASCSANARLATKPGV